MKQTERLSLSLFEGSDNFDFTVLNENFRKVEDAFKNGGGAVTDAQIAQAVADYLRNNPVETGTKIVNGSVELLADCWVSGGENLWSQVVDIHGVTANTQIDLTPSAEQLAIFRNKDIAFVAGNKGGVVTVYAIGQKPTNDYTMQITMKEVTV